MHCRVCENNTIELLIDFGMQPIIHHLTEKQDQKYDSYPFRLGYCTTCNFMGIMEYISPETLYANYFTPSGWKYEPHISTLITTIQNLIGIDPKTTILDIGCNDGKFLEELKIKGYKKLFGVEPAADTYSIAKEKGFEVYNGFFGKQSAENVYSSNFFDLVVTRQVLEHIADLDNFLEGISYVLKDRGCLVIEVPDSEWNLDCLDYALWEEHVNYFTISSLRSLLRKHSFEVFHYESICLIISPSIKSLSTMFTK